MKPVDLSRHEGATPGPWGLSQAILQVHGKEDVVCEITRGEWGDPYPALEINELGHAVPVNKLIPYGCVSEEEAQANARLITDAHLMREEIIFLRDYVKAARGDSQAQRDTMQKLNEYLEYFKEL